jgi:hypothetical protein
MRCSDTADRSDGKLKAQVAALRELGGTVDHEAGLIVRALATVD